MTSEVQLSLSEDMAGVLNSMLLNLDTDESCVFGRINGLKDWQINLYIIPRMQSSSKQEVKYNFHYYSDFQVTKYSEKYSENCTLPPVWMMIAF